MSNSLFVLSSSVLIWRGGRCSEESSLRFLIKGGSEFEELLLLLVKFEMANPRSMLGREDEELPVEVPGVKGLRTERSGGGVVLLVSGFWRAAARNWVSCGTAETGTSLVHSGPSPLTWKKSY